MPPTTGINLNNPGNIRHSDSRWDGASRNQAHNQFVTFDTPEDGIRALTKTLRTYSNKHGLRTVSGIIGRWAPPEENNTDSYIRSVSSHLGVTSGQPLDLDDERVLTGLAKAITQHENGAVPYTEDQFQSGVRAALRDSPPAVSDARTAVRRAPDTVTPDMEEAFPFKDVARQALPWTWALDAERHAPDPNFAPDAPFFEEHLTQVPKEFWEDLVVEAHSEKHFFYLRDRLLEDLEGAARLRSYGWTAQGATLLASFFDPVENIAAASVGGPVGLALSSLAKINKASRLQRLYNIAGTAVAGGVGLGAATALTLPIKPTGDAEDVLYAAAAGMALGAGYGVWRTRHLKDEMQGLHQASTRLMQRLDDDLHAEYVGASAGAAEAPAVREQLRSETGSYLFPSLEAPETAMGAVRFDSVGQLKSSANPVSRALGELGEDGVGNKDASIALKYGATELKTRLSRKADTQWARAFEPAYSEWAQARGMNWFERRVSRDTFAEEVTQYVRGVDGGTPVDPAVKRAGEEFRKIVAEMGELAANPGKLSGEQYRPVSGFESFTKDALYAPRVFDARKLDDARARVGDKAIRELIANGIRRAQPHLEDSVVKSLAKGYWRVVRDSRWLGQEARIDRAFAGQDIDFLRQALAEHMAPDEITHLAHSLKSVSEGGVNPGRSRLAIDEGVSVTAWGETLRFTDLLNNNSNDLLRGYVQEVAGAVALARIRVRHPQGDNQYLIDGITSEGDWRTVRRELIAVGERIGQKDTDLQRDLDNLDYLYDVLTGVPHHLDTRPAGQTMRLISKINFVRLMGQVGFAQIAEIGQVTTQMGLKAAYHGIPTLRTFRRDVLTGALKDPLADELEGVFGIGADWLRGARLHGLDTMADPRSLLGQNQVLNTADRALEFGKRGLLAVSGMSMVNTLLHRWALRAIAHKFSKMADGTSSMDWARLRSLGLNTDLETRALAELNKHKSVEKGFWRDQVTRINFDKWSDLEAREAFIAAMDRQARKMVLENDAGTMHRWMRGPLAAMLLQFRVFMLGAYSKHLLHPIHMARTSPEAAFVTFSGFMGSSLWAAIGYTMQTSVQGAFRSDREEYLKKKLSFSEMAKASFQRASYASLIPTGVDTARAFAGLDPFFTARSTTLPSNVLLGNPTVDLVFDAPGRVVKGLHKGALTQRDVRATASLVPLQNTVPIQAFLNLLIQDLPE